ncbi:MAG TPA: DUF5330 domain-containing protein [Xanthobacteraceae bacterium]|jgi:hypothetical protein
MWFLVRMAFWLSVVLVLLPSGGSQPAPNAPVSASDAFSAARAAVDDMRQFCNRQPEACVVGSSAAVAIGHRAQAGAKLIYELLSEQLGPNDTGSDAVDVSGASMASRDTLKASDLAPAWRGRSPGTGASRPPDKPCQTDCERGR